MNKDLFKNICDNYKKNLELKTIGVLNEKALHNIIKNYYEANEKNQEIKVGKYYADIKKDNHIIEIQTAAFNKLRNKLIDFLKEYKVKIIYPIIKAKKINWLGTNKERKSPKEGSIYDCFKELYKIKQLLNSPNLEIVLLLINAVEYRNLDGYDETGKKGSSRNNMIPYELVDEIVLNDFNIFIPFDNEFNVKQFARIIKRNKSIAGLGVNILKYLKVIEVISKEGNALIYKKIKT